MLFDENCMEYRKKMKKIDKYYQNISENPNYLRIGAKNKTFYSKKMVFYVHFVQEDEENNLKTREIMGPYNAKTAEIIMSNLLKQGLCCWIEESCIR